MRSLSIVLVLCLGAAVHAQPASQAGAPLPAPDVLALPALDNAALVRAAEGARRAGPAPVRFAEPVEVSVEPAERGTWTGLPDGSRVWRLVVASPGAYSLSFGFTRFRLPEGASLWIYAEGEAPEYRPFTAADNERHGQLWTPIVPGDRAVVEVNLPPTKLGRASGLDLKLERVNHAFRPTLLIAREKASRGGAASGACNVDVVCPQGDDYRDIIRSVGAYTVGGVDFCSGAAINTTAADDRPLFLTANHCGVGEGNAAQVVVYWNYQNSTCRAPGSFASGEPGDGSRAQFNAGTISRGSGPVSDWSVLEFDDPILPTAGVFLAGWDRRDLAPTSAVTIHHPSVQEKRISFENQATTITTYSSNASTPTGTHIRVADWDLGTTEGGSSGSPLFNSDRRIVGQLHGGAAACGNDQPDWYGRLFRSMNDGLAAVLDPAGTGAPFVDGKDYEAAAYAAADVSAAQARVGETVRFSFTIGNPTSAAIGAAQFVNTLPAGLTFAGDLVASIGTASRSGRTITWGGALPAGATLTVAYDATVGGDAPEGDVENRSTTRIGGGQPDLVSVATLRVLKPRPEPDVVLDAAPRVAIPDYGCPDFVTTTQVVTEAFTVGRVSVGVGVRHTWRGDLRVRLSSPEGTTVDLINRVGAGSSGSGHENLDVLIDDGAAAGAFALGDHSVATPYYAVEGAPEAGDAATGGVGTLSTFIGEPAQGTWTLGVCDSAPDDTGTIERWSLQFVRGGAVTSEGDPTVDALSVTLSGANPVTAETRATIAVDRLQHVRVTLVDATGREVRVLHDAPVRDDLAIGVRAANVSAGTYFLRIEAASGTRTLPVTVVR